MIVTAIQTPIIQSGDDIRKVIADSVQKIQERSILVVSSKIVSTCEDRFVEKIKNTKEEKQDLVRNEAELYTEPHSSKHNMMLTIKHNLVFVNAGIDQSNSDNKYILWPSDPQKSVNTIWNFVREHYGIREIGVTLSDSSSFMLSWGVIGRAIAHCGFNPLLSYVGQKDLFGRTMRMEQSNIMQSVTDAAVFEMGEGSECTPIAVVSDFGRSIDFQNHEPTDEELQKLKIDLEDDVYYPILKNTSWHMGGSFNKK